VSYRLEFRNASIGKIGTLINPIDRDHLYKINRRRKAKNTLRKKPKTFTIEKFKCEDIKTQSQISDSVFVY
jgi:hypothetical protein